MSKITVTFDKSSEDIPTLMIARDTGYLFGGSTDIINVITGDEAVEIWNKLNKVSKVEIKKMKFIINDLKYDTDKMEKIADVKKWYPTNNALIKAMYNGLEVGQEYTCELWKSKKGNYLLTHDQDYSHKGEAISEEEAMKLIKQYDLTKFEEIFGEIEEA